MKHPGAMRRGRGGKKSQLVPFAQKFMEKAGPR